jgi:hypothetical protein
MQNCANLLLLLACAKPTLGTTKGTRPPLVRPPACSCCLRLFLSATATALMTLNLDMGHP